jgi:hypothetical protein
MNRKRRRSTRVDGADCSHGVDGLWRRTLVARRRAPRESGGARIYWLAERRAGCVAPPHAANRSPGGRAFKSVKLQPFRSGSHSGGHYAQAVRLRRPTLYPLSYRRANRDDSRRAWIDLRLLVGSSSARNSELLVVESRDEQPRPSQGTGSASVSRLDLTTSVSCIQYIACN